MGLEDPERQAASGDMTIVELTGIPPIDDCSYALVYPDAPCDTGEDAYLQKSDAAGNARVIAFLDMTAGAAYPCDRADRGNPADTGAEPLVKTVGCLEGDTGQVVIKQPEGHWRRYSRWDRLPKAPPTQPDAVVRTLPQCGCGGYLGAPMMFASFAEMIAYFFVVFSDAAAVNAKHADILNGKACPA